MVCCVRVSMGWGTSFGSDLWHALNLCLSCCDVTPRVTPFAQTHPADARAQGLAAWEQVYSVLTHPRCINCHTATAYPQQGDDRQRHFANVVRGPEGQGVPGLHCASCHQETNADSTGVPGGQ